MPLANEQFGHDLHLDPVSASHDERRVQCRAVDSGANLKVSYLGFEDTVPTHGQPMEAVREYFMPEATVKLPRADAFPVVVPAERGYPSYPVQV